MTIVCATRFSEESHRAVNAAAAIARMKGESLSLVHVMPTGMLKTFSRGLQEHAQKALDEEVQRLSEGGLSVSGHVLSGKLEKALAHFCAHAHARMLVVGDTAGRASTFLAGNLDRLAYAVEAPLLVVRDAAPFEQWGTEPLRVMIAFDQTASSAVARDWVARLSAFGPMELVATQIYWPLEEYEERGIKVPADENHAALKALLQRELEVEFGAMPANVKVTIRLEVGAGHIAEHLLAVASDAQVDLIILGTHRKRALDRLFSVSHKLLLQAPMAVICVPSTVVVPHLAKNPSWTRALVSTDFGEAGNRAIAWAASLLDPGSTLHVAHIASEPFSPEAEPELTQRLSDSLPPDIEAGGVRVVAQVQHGEPEVILRNLALTLDVDVIVIGAQTLPDFEEAEEGVIAVQITEQWSLVQTLLEKTHRPVLLTPPLRA